MRVKYLINMLVLSAIVRVWPGMTGFFTRFIFRVRGILAKAHRPAVFILFTVCFLFITPCVFASYLPVTGPNIGIGTTTPVGGLVVMNGNVGIGTWSPIGSLEVKGGSSTKIWTGVGTNTNALSAGELYVEGDLEVDGTIYGDGSGLTGTSGLTIAGGWTDGGTNVFLTTTTDNVGIGTTTPTASLLIENTGTVDSFRVNDILLDTTPLIVDAAGNIGIGTTTAEGGKLIIPSGNVGFGTLNPVAGLAVMTGNVGIGTWSPTESLSVAGGNVRLSGANLYLGRDSVSPVIIGSNSNGGGAMTIIGGTSTTGSLSLESTQGTGTTDFINFLVGTNGTTEAMRIQDNSGIVNIGIGTSTPVGGLTVMSGNVGIGTWSPTAPLEVVSAGDNQRSAIFKTPGTGWNEINVSSGATANLELGAMDSLHETWVKSEDTTSSLWFGTNDVERMRIDIAGNIGIATINPKSRFVVNGGVGIGTLNSSTFINTTAPNGGLIVENNVGIGTTTPVGGLTIMNGNVGIGTWSPRELLELNGRMLMSDSAVPGTTTNKLYANGGSLYWNGVQLDTGAAASGWLDAGVLMYQADTSDLVGIGTTTPSTTLEIVKQSSNAPLMVSSVGTGDGDYLLITSSGNVGIGTLLPRAKVEIGEGSTPRLMVSNGNIFDKDFLVVTSTGLIGLGTLSPGAHFEMRVFDDNALPPVGLRIRMPDSTGDGPNIHISNDDIGASFTAATVVGVQNVWDGGDDYTAYGFRNIVAPGSNSLFGDTGTSIFYGFSNVFTEAQIFGGPTMYGLYNDMPAEADDGSTETIFGTYTRATTYANGSDIFYGNFVEGAAASTGGLQYGVFVDLTAGTAAKYPAVFMGGNVGIGTTTPRGSLIVSSGNVGIGTLDPLGGLIVMTGNVGIGTWSPLGALEIKNGQGAVRIWTGAGTDTNATSAGELYVEGDLEVDGTIYGDGSGLTGTSGLTMAGGWTDGGTNVYTTTTTDNVGIGTTTPNAATLEIVKNAAQAPLRISGSATGAGDFLNVSSAGLVGIGTTLNSPSTGLSIINGNVGIGTWNARNRLDVQGNIGIGTQNVIYMGSNTFIHQGVGSNLFVGPSAGNLTLSSTGNAAFGSGALNGLTTGEKNTALGSGTLVTNSTGSNNTVVGYLAGQVATGSNNVFLGYQAGTSVTGSNNLLVGYDITAPSLAGSNQMVIGNILYGTGIDGTGTTFSSGNIGIGTSKPAARLAVAGNVGIGTGINSAFLTATPPAGGMIIEGSVGVGTTTPVGALTVMNGNVGIGTWSPIGQLEVKGGSGATRIWTGAGTDTNATSAGELYVEGDLEVDGTIYGDGSGLTGTSGLTMAGGWTDGGTNVYTTTTTDNVGIGTTTPNAATLEIVQNAAQPVFKISSVATGDGNYLTVASTGNVGIGTTTTAENFVVGGRSRLGSGIHTSSVNSAVLIGRIGGATDSILSFNSQTYAWSMGIDNSEAAFKISNVVAADPLGTNPVFTILNTGNVGISTVTPVAGLSIMNGNVGIGTWSPIGQLEVKGGSGATRIWTGAGTDTNATAAGELYVEGDLEVDGSIYGDGSNITGAIQNGGGWTDGGTNVFTSTTTDNVGIGTTTPTSTLEVVKTAAGTAPLMVSSTATTDGDYLLVASNGNVGVGTTNPQGALIVMNGNVGIGTIAPQRSLHIKETTLIGRNMPTGLISGTYPDLTVFSTLGNPASIAVGGKDTGDYGAGELLLGLANSSNAWTSLYAVTAESFDISGGSTSRQYTVTDKVTSQTRFKINASGNVGIGTDFSPDARLEVVSAGADALMVSNSFDDNGNFMKIDSVGNVGIGTTTSVGGLTVMNGNVGIGTWSPTGKLQVVGGQMIIGIGDSSAPALAFSTVNDGVYSSAGALRAGMGGVPNVSIGNGGLAVHSGNTSPFFTNAPPAGGEIVEGNVGIGTWMPVGGLTVMNGNVGIGTWSPIGQLEVKGGSGATRIWTGTGTDANATAAGELYVEGDLEVDGTIYGDGSGITGGTVSNAGGWTDGGTNVYTSTTTDNVGIGTTTPTSTLEVVKTAAATAPFMVSSTATRDGDVFVISSAGNVGIGTTLNSSTTGLAIMNGNVGIGTWSPRNALELRSASTLQGSSALYLSNSSVSHGMTSQAPDDVFGTISMYGNDSGGLYVAGIAEGNAPGVRILGIDATSDPNDGQASVEIFGAKASGAGGGPLGDNETVLQVWNGATTSPSYQPFTIMGSMNVGIGTVTPVGALTVMNGNVGIGTWSPIYRLQVIGALDATAITQGGVPVGGTSGWTDGGTNVYTSTTTDNVGIGTTTPINRLSVEGSVGIGTTEPYRLIAAPNNGLVVEGNVGIGTWAPSAQLEIAKLGGQVPFMVSSVGSGNGDYLIVASSGIVGINQNVPTAGASLSVRRDATNTVGISISSSITSGTGINDATFYTTGTSISLAGSALTTGKMLSISGATGSGGAAFDFSGDMIVVNPTRNWGGGGAMTDSGNYLDIARSNTVSGGGTYDLTGDVAAFSSDCTETAGTCTDTSRILSLSQQFANATGTVFEATNAGLGLSLRVNDQTSDTTPFVIDPSGNVGIGTSGAGQGSLIVATGNVGIGTLTPVNGTAVMNGNVGIGTWSPTRSLELLTGGRGFRLFQDAWSEISLDASSNLLLSGDGAINIGSFNGTDSITIGQNTDRLVTINAGPLVIQTASGIGMGTTTPVGGVAIMVGNVGIGTWSPVQSLEVIGTAQMTGFKMPTGASNNYVLTSDVNGVGTWQAVAGASGWTDGGTNVYTTTTTDNVGIGTTTPSTTLEIVQQGTNPSLMISSVFDGDGNLMIVHSGGNVGVGTTEPIAKMTVENTGAIDSLRVNDITADPTPFIINQVGNVGIGTTAATYKLEIYDNDFTNNFIRFNQLGTDVFHIKATGTLPLFVYNNNGVVANGVFDDNLIDFGNATGSTGAKTTFFAINPDTAQAANIFAIQKEFHNLFVMNSSGNVGIGTATAGNGTLVVMGNVGIGTVNPVDGTAIMNGNVGIGTWSPRVLVEMGTTGGTLDNVGAGDVYIQNDLEVDGVIYGDAGGLTNIPGVVPSGWTDGGTNVYTSLTTDNVGIGTTTPSTTLEVVQQGSNAPLMISSVFNADGNLLIVHSGGNVGVGTTQPIAKMTVENVNAVDSLRVNDITNDTSPFIIDQNGNVGIGTSSASEKLIIPAGNVGIGTLNPVGGLVVMTGNVGIGTWSPTSQFMVKGSNTNNQIIANFVNTGTDTYITIGSSDTAGANEQMVIYRNTDTAANGWMVGMGDDEKYYFAYQGIAAAAELSEATSLMSISSTTGNVGIGAFDTGSEPGAKLAVLGNVGIGTTISNNNALSVNGGAYFAGNVGIGTLYPSTGGILDIRQDEVRIWTGVGTDTNATAAGELYVEGDLEVDGTIYGDGSGITSIGSVVGAAGWIDPGAIVYQSTTTDLVGIGTVTPSTTLEIVKQGTNAPLMISSVFNGDGDYFVVSSSGNVGVGTLAPTGGKLIVSSGNVGFGTLNPRGALVVVGGNVGFGTTNPRSTLQISDNLPRLLMFDTDNAISATNPAWSTRDEDGTYKMQTTTDYSTYTDRMVISPGGNVGIGTFMPVGGTAIMNGNVGIGTWSPTAKMIILGGNVGIGTLRPGTPVEIFNAAATGSTLRITGPDIGGFATTGIVDVNNGSGVRLGSFDGSTATPDYGLFNFFGSRSVTGDRMGELNFMNRNLIPADARVFTVAAEIGTIDAQASLNFISRNTNFINNVLYLRYDGAVGMGTTMAVGGLSVMSGNVGIGTWSPTGRLVVIGGNVGIGTTALAATLDVAATGSLRIPFGYNPTVSAQGTIGIGTVNHQFYYNSQGTKRVVPASHTRCMVIENLASGDDNFPMGSFIDAVTVTAVWCTCSGTCTTAAEMSLEDGSGNAMTHTAPVCADIGTVPAQQAVTAANTLTARESLRFDVDVAPVPDGADEYELCVEYNITAVP